MGLHERTEQPPLPSAASVQVPLRHPNVHQHPVIAALPEEARALLAEEGVWESARTGHVVRRGSVVMFVLEGALGRIFGAAGPCIALVGAGGVYGLDNAFGADAEEPLIALLNPVWLAVDAAALAKAGNEGWVERLFAHQARGRIRALSWETHCGVRHSQKQRLAKWLLRLHQTALSDTLAITQQELAVLLGVQRTSINAMVANLVGMGAVSVRRNRLVIRDRDMLRSDACDCDRATFDPSVARDGYTILRCPEHHAS
jgi:CRP-like cAMP-binding protein